MSDEPVLVTEQRDAVRILRLNRPEARNALSPELLGEIGRGMDIRYRETAGGGLAATPTGRKLAKERLVQLKGKKS